ncbi:MAG: hypothetical protein ACOYMF_06110 [Bacteroidales bacterium]
MSDIIKAENSLSQLSEQSVINLVNNLANFIARDVGIKGEVDQYEKQRFIGLVRKYYNDLTISQIKEAFEYAMVGRLDFYLPKDKDGNADKNHYQLFSAEYTTKILTAYRRLLNEKTPEKPKELAEHVITEHDKAMIHDTFIECIYSDFEAYRDSKKRPFIIVPLVFNKLVESGLITDDMPVGVSIDLIIHKIHTGNIYSSEWDKKSAMLAAKQGNTTPLIQREVEQATMAAKIVSAYQELIMNEQHISEIIKLKTK